MYKEEIGDMDLDSNLSSENASNPNKADHKKSSDQIEDQQQQSLAATNRVQMVTESTSDHAPHIEIMGSLGGIETISSSLFSGANRFVAAPTYNVPELGRFGNGSGGVSLTLGLQHCDGPVMPLSGGTHHGFLGLTGESIPYSAGTASAVAETSEYEAMNIGTQQQRFGPAGHLLHDFVA